MSIVDSLTTIGADSAAAPAQRTAGSSNADQTQSSTERDPASFSATLNLSLQAGGLAHASNNGESASSTFVIVKTPADSKRTDSSDDDSLDSDVSQQLSNLESSQIFPGGQLLQFPTPIPTALNVVNSATRSEDQQSPGIAQLPGVANSENSVSADSSIPQIVPQSKPPALPAALLQLPGMQSDTLPSASPPSLQGNGLTTTGTTASLPESTTGSVSSAGELSNTEVRPGPPPVTSTPSIEATVDVSSAITSTASAQAQQAADVVAGQMLAKPAVTTESTAKNGASITAPKIPSDVENASTHAIDNNRVQSGPVPIDATSVTTRATAVNSTAVAAIVAVPVVGAEGQAERIAASTEKNGDIRAQRIAASQSAEGLPINEEGSLIGATTDGTAVSSFAAGDGSLLPPPVASDSSIPGSRDVEDELDGDSSKIAEATSGLSPLTEGTATLASRVAKVHSRSEPSSEVDASRVVADTARGISTARQEGHEIHLRLDPRELGVLRIDVTLRDGQLTARLEAERATSHRLLADNLPQLREQLSQQGVQVDRIEVVHVGERPGSGGAQTQSFRQQDRQPQHSASGLAARENRREGDLESKTAESRPVVGRGSRARIRELDITV